MNRLITLLGVVVFFLLPVAAQSADLKLVVLGDSLSAGYQLAPEEGFPEQLQRELDARGHSVEVVNAGVSGDTTSGGLSRLDWSVGPDTDAVIVELGANDALRGISPEITRKNLEEITRRLKDRGIEVLLAGMLAPRNLGPEYADAFDPIYADIAITQHTLLYPFFLDGVALDPDLNLSDGMHPNADGVAVIVENILLKVEELLAKAQSS
ncbi:arylesterase [Roseibium marinum]|uniref:Acyl-CoA thioesterase-1 n=1 Tax=Roseibium marinum TaxID=281252 RepID=A0A2S3UY68_9HYPH|nr:arylesterase [Roseibium marinum]POF32672.1 acyl-CoA thioesterase-1 [Roseibium marinum]